MSMAGFPLDDIGGDDAVEESTVDQTEEGMCRNEEVGRAYLCLVL